MKIVALLYVLDEPIEFEMRAYLRRTWWGMNRVRA
jgi:hypothetical protein